MPNTIKLLEEKKEKKKKKKNSQRKTQAEHSDVNHSKILFDPPPRNGNKNKIKQMGPNET